MAYPPYYGASTPYQPRAERPTEPLTAFARGEGRRVASFAGLGQLSATGALLASLAGASVGGAVIGLVATGKPYKEGAMRGAAVSGGFVFVGEAISRAQLGRWGAVALNAGLGAASIGWAVWRMRRRR